MTDITSPAVVDDDTLVVRRSVLISATPEKVWQAVTEPEHIARWFGTPALRGTGVGAEGTISWPDRGGIPLRIEVFEPQRRVAYRWCNDDASGVVPEHLVEARSTVFTFSLERSGDGTLLTVVETGFELTSDPLANLESHRQGWNSELDKLIALLERDGERDIERDVARDGEPA